VEENILKRINIALLLLIVLSIVFTIYGIHMLNSIKKESLSSIKDEDIKDTITDSYNSVLTVVLFLLVLLIFTIVMVIFRLRKFLEIKQNAMFDQLTGLYNRHYFIKRFEEEIERSKRYKHPLSVLMLDLDNFKKYNDKYGHNKGDTLLKSNSYIILGSTRKIDVVARWGGEEFLILLPETKGRDAYVVAERIRANIEHMTHTTVSIGLVYYKYFYPSTKEMIEKADHFLYKAKQTGKNKICYR